MAGTSPVHVFIVDDNAVFRMGIRRFLEQSDVLAFVGEADSGAEALERIPEAQPEVAFVDISMRDMDGFELTRRLKQEVPAVSVVIVSIHSGARYVDRAFEVGADGYVLKDNVDVCIVEAAQEVREGRKYLGREIRRVLGKENGWHP